MLPDTSTTTLETRRSFGVHNPAMVWSVVSGTVNLFATTVTDGQVGALRPLFTLETGEAIFGLPTDDRLAITLIARQTAGSRVAVQPIESLCSLGMSHDVRVRWSDGLEQWVARLSRAVRTCLPKNVRVLEPGSRVAVEEDAQLLSAERLLWIRHGAGTSRLFGVGELVVQGSTPYPLAGNTWVEAQPQAEVWAEDGRESRLTDEHVEGLHAFHRNVLIGLVREIETSDEQVRTRLREKATADAKTLEAAVRHLASPLTDEDAVAVSAETFDTPLLRACRIVGGALGVEMKPHPDMLRGVKVRDPVTAIARASGVRYRRVALKDFWWKESSEPLLVFRRSDQHPLALIPRRSRQGYLLYDPDSSAASSLDARAVASLDPFAFMFYRAFPQKPLSIRDLLAFGVAGSRADVILILIMTLGVGAASMAMPLLTGVIVDSLILSARRSQVVVVAAMLVVASVAAAGFTITRGFAVLRLQGRMSAKLQAGLWDRLLALPVPFFRDYSAGDLANRSIAISQIRSMLTTSTLGAVFTGASSIFSLGLLFYYSWPLALLATALTAVAAAVTVAASVFELRYQRQVSEQIGHITGVVLEFIGGITKFRVANAERRAFALWVKEFAAQKRTAFRALRITNRLTVFNSVYAVASLGVIFYAQAKLNTSTDNKLTTGDILAFITGFTQFLTAALSLSSAVVGILNVVPLYERAAPILRTLPEVVKGQASPGELTGDIEAHHLEFRYHADAPIVLSDLSFHVRAREYVAFVGPSGCGKSTLLRLLLGFETPVSGGIYLDGKELSGLDIEAVRQQIGVVLQTGRLLSGSLRDNICGPAAVSPEDVMTAVRLAGLEEDIAQMPMGLHTMLLGAGGGLSGGQRQRVLIARAIVLKPRILMFDEATSALDNRTQAIVIESLKSLNATRLVVAHRLSTIVDADRIYVMDQGRIVQTGTYAELMREPGLFRKLAERQLT